MTFYKLKKGLKITKIQYFAWQSWLKNSYNRQQICSKHIKNWNKTLPTKDPQTFTLKNNSNGNSWDLPVIEGTVGPKVIDVRHLYADTDCFTYDPGFTSTGSNSETVHYIKCTPCCTMSYIHIQNIMIVLLILHLLQFLIFMIWKGLNERICKNYTWLSC